MSTSTKQVRRPDTLSEDFIPKLTGTIHEVQGFFQLVQFHRKRQKFYSTHISDGYFKCKVIFKEQPSQQIDYGSIKLFSILYGKVTNHGNKVLMARTKLISWDYHRVIGLVKPWKHQKPNVNLQGSHIIRWEDSLDCDTIIKDDIQPVEQRTIIDNKTQTQSVEFSKEKVTIKTSKEQTNQTKISGCSQNLFMGILDNMEEESEVKKREMSNKCGGQSEIKNIKKKLLVDEEDQPEQNKIFVTSKKDNFYEELFCLRSHAKPKSSSQICEPNNSQEDEQINWDDLSKISKAIPNRFNIPNIPDMPNVLKNTPVEKQHPSEDQDVEDDELSGLIEQVKKQSKKSIITAPLSYIQASHKHPTNQLNRQQDQKESKNKQYAIVDQIKQSDKNHQANRLSQIKRQQERLLELLSDDEESIESSADLDDGELSLLIQKVKIQNCNNQKFKEVHRPKNTIFEPSCEIDPSELTVNLNYEASSWLSIKPICHRIMQDKNQYILLMILRVKDNHIANFYIKSPKLEFQQIDSLKVGRWAKLSLKNVAIIEPKQTEYRNHFELQAALQNIRYEEDPGKTSGSANTMTHQFPYAPISKMQSIHINTIVNMHGIIKSTFHKSIKGKNLIKLVILDIQSQDSIEFVIFTEDNVIRFNQEAELKIQDVLALVNEPIFVFNAKITSYQGKKSLQNRNNTICVVTVEDIFSRSETTQKIRQELNWVKQNHVDNILNDEQKYENIRCVANMMHTSLNYSMFHIQSCKIYSFSPFYFYEGCPKCSKRVFPNNNPRSTSRVCQSCGIIPDDKVIMRYYISANMGDATGVLKIIWGHTECKHIFDGSSKKANDGNFQEFKGRYLNNLVQLWLKINQSDEKYRGESTIYSVMKIQLLPLNKSVSNNVKDIYKFLQFNR